ncbi:hypothetical protein KEH59_01420 (plasmid) [Burkholderia contaminans]|uniref:hypothetical protein n=1 Tax=Burkholderia contaminans TaxID=488447 RepID=UPI001BAB02A0|nr:hypothetical protein [Burkholderia contaminans]QUN44924.1 hypothetical protein KEH59_01420 [Burkholderia contaminans]
MSKQPVDQIARIEGIPFADGYYWYYKRGEPLPSLVLVGERDEQRVFKDGPAVCKTWWPGSSSSDRSRRRSRHQTISH